VGESTNTWSYGDIVDNMTMFSQFFEHDTKRNLLESKEYITREIFVHYIDMLEMTKASQECTSCPKKNRICAGEDLEIDFFLP
jgi:hypothetical protein